MIKRHLSSAQIIIFGFLGTILIGTFLLMLPISSASGAVTSFSDSLFTATSAVCVTGLIVHDTATYWSMFGQFVILILIQIGGLGVVTVAVATALISGRKIGLMQRSTLKDAFSAQNVGGIVRLTGFVLKSASLIELIGAMLLAAVFCKDFGIKGVWLGFFHSISAFCNAGFDLMGTVSPFSSLTSYYSRPLVNITVILLIISGGIGFLVWDDIKTNKLHLKKYRMQSKVALSVTAFLIIIPFIYFYLFEFSNFKGSERIYTSLFQTVTTRTAGFNTADLTQLSGVGKSIMVFLMLIGGSPGSTAGGMKTTTIAVLVFSSLAVFGRKDDVECFDRRIPDTAIKNAAAIFLTYLFLFTGGGFIIHGIEKLPLSVCLFETASAIGTVGLSLGITPTVGNVSRVILIALMFFGRVGGLTVIFAAVSNINKNISKKPQEQITVG